METKACRQCGELKPIGQFRKYYGGRSGTYTTCLACERINSRAKYLARKGQNVSQVEQVELNKIYRLYDAQRACGLRPPRSDAGKRSTLAEDLDSLISVYTDKANAAEQQKGALDVDATPQDLRQWLTCELTHEPDYYLDDVYESLRDKYMPVLRIDEATMLPVRDETYSTVLDQILSRFNDYEDTYYNKEEDN